MSDADISPQPTPALGELRPAPDALRKSAIGLTALHAVLTAVAVVSAGTTRGVIAVVFVVIFLVSIVAFVAAFFTAANRSRDEHVSTVGAFFLGDSAVTPTDRRIFTAAAVIQAIVGIVGASLRPFTAVAFSVLVALAGLAMMALVGARYGRFERRDEHGP